MHHTEGNGPSKGLSAICQKKYDEYLFSIQEKLACPHCSNPAGLRRHGRYQRHLYINEFKRCLIKVFRMICTCGRTFVVLPPRVVPYKRYLLGQVLRVIRLAQRQTVYHANQVTGIACCVIKFWIKQYVSWHKTLVEAHSLLDLSDDGEAATIYNRERHGRRLMQAISAPAQRFHNLFWNHIVSP